MTKKKKTRYNWIGILLLLILVNFVAAAVHFRSDLTSEKTFYPFQPTHQLLQSLDEPVRITVFLSVKCPPASSGFPAA
jgi:ABC-type uncharacterized transport system involved in gliding motility auxiliary subunit